jgi:hypothetical protein
VTGANRFDIATNQEKIREKMGHRVNGTGKIENMFKRVGELLVLTLGSDLPNYLIF